MIIKFTIPGQPVAKARVRVGKFGSFTPARTVNYENLVKTFAHAEFSKTGSGLLEGPVSLKMKAYFTIPVSRKKKLKESDRHCQRPDLDNILKSVKDGMSGVVYHDDALIWKVDAEKLWGEIPRVEVELES